MEIILVEIDSLNSFIKDTCARKVNLPEEDAFVAWFIHIYLDKSESEAVKSITNGTNDQGIDAIVIDHPSQSVYIIQGKYRAADKGSKVITESRSDVLAFAGIFPRIVDEDSRQRILQTANSRVSQRLKLAWKWIEQGFDVDMVFLTTGRVAYNLVKDAEIACIPSGYGDIEPRFMVFSSEEIKNLWNDYLNDAAPPIPMLPFPLASEDCLHRWDETTQIDSYVFTMHGGDVAKLYETGGRRIFARNIRGYLGEDTKVNADLERTLTNESKYFWYFNNGITVICDKAKLRESKGEKFLDVWNPQIINGQQTVRSIARHPENDATILVKVMHIPRRFEGKSSENFDLLISNMVKATNWQNSIDMVDLRSNDYVQIRLDRNMRKLRYHYIRKKKSKKEVSLEEAMGEKPFARIKSSELARATCACVMDPAIIREGKEALFEEKSYVRIFDSQRAPYEFLTYYWIDRVVRSRSSGYPSRYYARYHVDNLIWSMLSKTLSKHSNQLKFVNAMERRNYKGWDVYKSFQWLCENAFRVTSSFFKTHKRGAKEKIDESGFFRRHNLHEKLLKYSESSTVASARHLRKVVPKFVEKLDEFQL